MRFPPAALILACCLALGSPGARIASAVTLEGVARLALANNRDLRAAYFEVEKARSRLLQAGLWPNPSLELSGSSDKLFNDEGQSVITAGFIQAFPVSGRLRLAREVSRVDVAQAIAEIRNRERLLIGEAQRAFVAVVANAEAIAARREVLGVDEEFVDLSQQRLAAAQASQVDVNLARIESQRLRQEIDLLEIERRANLFALRQKLGLGTNAPLAVEGSLRAIADRLATSASPAAALARRPDLRGLELAADRAGAEGRLSRADAWGDPTLGITYDRNRATDAPIGLKTDQFVGLRVSVPIPFYNRNQGKVREQAAAGNQAQAQAAALELTVRSEIATAADRAERLRGVLASYQGNLLPLVSQNTDLLKQGYAAGKTDFTQIIQSQTQRGTLRTGYVDALRDRANALVDLQTAAAASPLLNLDFLRSRQARPASRASVK